MSAPTARERPAPSSRSPPLAFTVCFYAWSLLGPLGPDLQDALGLSDFQTSAMVAVPVLLGSLMRIPLGWLTDRHGGRRVFSALMAFTPLPLVALALWHDSLGADPRASGSCSASPARRSPSACRSSTAGTRPERQGFALGIYGMGMGGTVLAGLTAPRIADAWGLAAPFWVAAGLIVGHVRASSSRSPATRRGRRDRSGARHVRRALGVPHQRPRVGADALLLPGLRRLRRDVPLPAQAAHRRPRPHARPTPARAPPASRCSPSSAARLGGWLSDRIGAARVLLVSFVAVAVLALVLAAAYTAMVPLTIACLTMAVALGLGTGAVFKLVPEWFPDRVGAVTGVVGAAGGLGGFFPPLVMGIVKSATGGYALGFVLMALVALACLRRAPRPRVTAGRARPAAAA